MKKVHFIKISFLKHLLIILSFTFVIEADNAENAALIMQMRVSPTVYGIDTIYRVYNYSVNGALQSIVDTPRTVFHPAYAADYDTAGEIKSIREYRDTLINSTEYFWEADNKIRFEKQWTGGQKIESGTIVYYGKLRAADLPENNSFAPENYLPVRADSTQYLDETGKIVTTWVWFYDSLDNNIRWQRRDPGDTALKWVEEYTYRYYANGLIDRRSVALAGDMIINVYGNPTTLRRHGEMIKIRNNIIKENQIKSDCYLVNGRKTGRLIYCNNRKKTSSIMFVKIDSEHTGMAFSSFFRKKD